MPGQCRCFDHRQTGGAECRLHLSQTQITHSGEQYVVLLCAATNHSADSTFEKSLVYGVEPACLFGFRYNAYAQEGSWIQEAYARSAVSNVVTTASASNSAAAIEASIENFRHSATRPNGATECVVCTEDQPCLFDIIADPEERHDISLVRTCLPVCLLTHESSSVRALVCRSKVPASRVCFSTVL